jgi:nucleotide-binding universal stress UspA family protein
MKVLLALDGSPYSEMAAITLKALQLPPATEVTVMTVIPEHMFLGGVNLRGIVHTSVAREATKAQELKAAQMLEGPVETLRTSGLTVESILCRGKPEEEILKRARKIGAQLVVIGAKGSRSPRRFPLGSVTQKVMKYADANVLLVRESSPKIRRVLVAVDGSKHSDDVVQFMLDLPLSHKAQVFVVTVMRSWSPAMAGAITMDAKTDRQILSQLRAEEEKEARLLMDKTKQQFREKGYEVTLMLLRGEPADQILNVAKTLNPDLVALGAKGLTSIDSFLLGSVAQRVARFSRYSVLVGRAPERQG